MAGSFAPIFVWQVIRVTVDLRNTGGSSCFNVARVLRATVQQNKGSTAMNLAGTRLVKGVFTRKISGDVHLVSTSILFTRIAHRRRARQKYSSSSLGVGFHPSKNKWVMARDNKILRRPSVDTPM